MEKETIIAEYITDGGDIYKLPSFILYKLESGNVYCPIGYESFPENSEISFVPIGKRSPVLYDYVENESFCIIL